MYLSMIDEHIISVESKESVFNDAIFFNTNAHSCNGDVLNKFKCSRCMVQWYKQHNICN